MDAIPCSFEANRHQLKSLEIRAFTSYDRLRKINKSPNSIFHNPKVGGSIPPATTKAFAAQVIAHVLRKSAPFRITCGAGGGQSSWQHGPARI
jgi:hypothetical protein